MLKRRLAKRLCTIITAIVLVISMIPMGIINLSADQTLLGYKGPYLDDDKHVATYMRKDYFKQGSFEIQFMYDAVGTPSSSAASEGFNDTFEFVVFDTNNGGMKKTKIGPNGYDKTGTVKPVKDKVYKVTVPISVIENKLLSGQAYGIMLQTGGIGTSIVSVASLKYISSNTPYVQKEFTATGSWSKGNSGTMTVSPKGAAIVKPGVSDIEVSAVDFGGWTNPTVEVTVTYPQAKNNVQAEILVNGKPVKSNYVNAKAGTYTYSTKLPLSASSFTACYDGCSVTRIKVYDKEENIPIIPPEQNNPLIENGGPYDGDATYIQTFMKSDYQGKGAFELKYKFTEVGTPSAPQEGEADLGYGDTFEFLVFDTAWGGWNRTTVGPAGIDTADTTAPINDQVYTATVDISTIEAALSTTASPYGINLQTGAQLGTSKVEIVSLKYVDSTTPYVQKAFTATGSWTKGTASTMTVTPNGAAVVNSNEWNIEVSGLDLSAWTNPTVGVTVTYAAAQTYVQAEILVDGTTPIPLDPNYPSPAAGTYTYTTEIPNTTESFLACYDACTVTEIKVYDNVEGNVEKVVTGQTASTIANDMGLVWNLGNSLEAVDGNSASETYGQVGEKAWGNPKTTKKLIQAVKAAGFNTIRVPISYLNKIGTAPNYEIDTDYLDRIQQVVDYAYDMGMYVVINIHNDGGEGIPGKWLNVGTTDETARAEMVNKFGKVWAQIADKFADYDQKLIFEAANELMITGNYNQAPAPAYTNINTLNQKFVDVVRAAGTNNADRALIVTGYNTNIDLTTTAAGFVKPTDSTQNRLMLSVHYYAPDDFTMGSATQWPTGEEVATNYYSEAYMEAQIDKAAATGLALGMPVFLGEYGPENHSDNTAARAYYCNKLNEFAAGNGIVTAYWDNGFTGQGGTALFDRTNNVITAAGQTIVDAIIAGYNEGK